MTFDQYEAWSDALDKALTGSWAAAMWAQLAAQTDAVNVRLELE